jgi:DNA-binding transcriptional LysR family regulator
MIDEIAGDFLQWLRGFYFVAKEGSVRQAAVAMGREKPTVSRQIQCLEKELGVALFDRSFGKMRITPAGKIVQEEAVALFEYVTRLKNEFRDEEINYRGRIVIATTHVIADSILPPYIVEFRRLHPEVTFHLEGGIRNTVYEKVESAEADFGIGFCKKSHYALSFHSLYETGLVMIAPRNNPYFTGKAPPTLKQIAEAPLILRGSHETLVEERFSKERLKPNVVMTHNNFVGIKKYVALGMGVAIVGGNSIFQEDRTHFDIYSLDRHFPKSRYGIVLKKYKYLPAMVKAFIRTIKPDIDFSAHGESPGEPGLSLPEFLRKRVGPDQTEAKPVKAAGAPGADRSRSKKRIGDKNN